MPRHVGSEKKNSIYYLHIISLISNVFISLSIDIFFKKLKYNEIKLTCLIRHLKRHVVRQNYNFIQDFLSKFIFILEPYIFFSCLKFSWHQLGYKKTYIRDATGHVEGIWCMCKMTLSNNATVFQTPQWMIFVKISHRNCSWVCTRIYSNPIPYR